MLAFTLKIDALAFAARSTLLASLPYVCTVRMCVASVCTYAVFKITTRHVYVRVHDVIIAKSILTGSTQAATQNNKLKLHRIGLYVCMLCMVPSRLPGAVCIYAAQAASEFCMLCVYVCVLPVASIAEYGIDTQTHATYIPAVCLYV